ncbi:unnamed protein product [Rhizophagus irregularis]|nr:unnamed protein product [Rhizophagus irregularis]
MNPTHDQDSNVILVKGCTDINQLTQLTSPSLNYTDDKMAFFYNPPNDKTSYRISCRLISHSLIVQFLNKKMYGIELRQGEEQHQDFLTFSNVQRDNLEFHMKEFIFKHVTQKKVENVNNNVLSTRSDTENKIIVQPKL